ncbi:MAG: 2-hydroxyacyl-CoA dehydratase [Nitrospiraceae bacterium]|nr:MAG: 2-hydroxyacyl-CoA dehydratase [Nitrospiraceae bacterium]
MTFSATQGKTARRKQFQNYRDLIRGFTRKTSPYNTLEASKKRLAFTADLFSRAYSDDETVVWRSSFVPTELMYAMGFIPFPPETIVAMLANAGFGSAVLAIAEDNYHLRDTCSFLRGTFGASIRDCLPAPDFVACTSLYCDGSAKLFYQLAREYGRPYFFIDVPYHHERERAVDYVARQLEEMVKEMERLSGVKCDPGKLSRAMEYSNQARDYFTRVNDLRKTVPSPIYGGEAINYAAMLSHTWGAKETVRIYELLCHELEERVARKEPAVDGGEAHRVLWRNLKPYYSDYLMQYLEFDKRTVIAFEEANCIHWNELDVQDPFKGLARKMLSNPPLGVFERWLEYTLRFLDDYSIEGVIEYAHWGCRHLNSGTQMLKDALQERGIPLLIIDGDCIDSRDYSEGQVRTRIDAFIELLEVRS